MAFYYCKSGGTATGDGGRYTSEKANNSWATEFTATSEYYDSIESAFGATTQPVAADVIYVSSASTFSKGSAIALTLTSPPDSPILCYSVNDAAVQDFLAGASETTGSTNSDYAVSSGGLHVVMHGISIGTSDDVIVTSPGASLELNGGTITLIQTGDAIKTGNGDGSIIILNNVSIVSTDGTGGSIFFISHGGVIEMHGGSTVATSNSLNDVIGGQGNAGGEVRLTGVDLSNHGTGTFILGSYGNNPSQDDSFKCRIKRCKLNANVSHVEEEFASPSFYYLATNSAATAAESEYQFHQKDWGGTAEDEPSAGIIRVESTAFDSGEKVSIKVVTNSSCGPGRPLIVDLPSRFAELSSASTDTIRIFFAQPNSQADLTDVNFYAKVTYEDGTNNHEWNEATNQATLLTSGTQHTDDSASSDWETNGVNLTSHDEYRMDIATSGDVGADCVPLIRIYIEEPSVTIYIDTTVALVA